MYWLIGTLIMLAMMGVLSVATDIPTALIQSLPFVDTSSHFLLPFLLSITTLALISLKRHTTLALSPLIEQPQSEYVIEPLSRSTILAQSSTIDSVKPSSKTASTNLINSRSFSFKVISYLVIAALALVLVVGSILQALTHHQQLEFTEITASTRVQAWVTIEGISDSVYDITTNSGYRQVATLSQIVPLTAELSAEDLAMSSRESTFNNGSSSEEGNSLSSDNTNNDGSNDASTQDMPTVEHRVLLSLYPKKENDDPSIVTLNNLQPGERVLMSLSLAPLASSEQMLNNPTGFDSYRWLRARHIDGVATIIEVSSDTADRTHSSTLAIDRTQSYWQRVRITVESWRLQLRQHFYQDWPTKTAAEQQAYAVTLSLLTGDRSLINRDTKDSYQLAGISHLLAISGTHVLFMAIMLAAIVVSIVKRLYPALYRSVPRWQVRWWVMIGSAFIYALFTGFDVPAARTAWMLLAIGMVRLTLLPISTMRILLALAIIMAWIDPYVLWQAGYWLSFIAVALLLKYEDTISSRSLSSTPRTSSSISSSRSRQRFMQTYALIDQGWLGFRRLFKLQFWLFIALLPITLLLFGKVSLWGLVVNLFAIGLFGWIIVPLNLLAGLCYLLSPTIADKIWSLVSHIVGQLHDLIEWLTTLSLLNSAWLYTPINFAMLLMAALVILPWLLPRGLLSRLLSLPPLTLLLMTIYSNQQSFSLAPTLYILSTGDRYLTAAVLIYPIDKSNTEQKNSDKNNNQLSTQDRVSWLFLADHRVSDDRSRPSTLTADKLAIILEQQLRTLAIKNLQGIIVQSNVPTLTSTLADTDKDVSNQAASKSKTLSQDLQPLLPQMVDLLSQALPTGQYWQAGRQELWSDRQKRQRPEPSSTNHKPSISVQDCQQGKQWQDLSGQLTLQALTGWSEIDDASVWDCSIDIVSQAPITVVHYNASNPQQPSVAAVQTLTANKSLSAIESAPNGLKAASRLVLDTATHKRSWQLWSLLCEAETLPMGIKTPSFQSITWLSHSGSMVSAAVLINQQVNQLSTYDEQPLEAALTLTLNE